MDEMFAALLLAMTALLMLMTWIGLAIALTTPLVQPNRS